VRNRRLRASPVGLTAAPNRARPDRVLSLVEHETAEDSHRGRILDLDPDLGASISEEDWETACRACRGALLSVPSGVWELPDAVAERNDVLGLVLVEGALCREVALRDRYMFELLGPGDVLHVPVAHGGPRLGGKIKLTALAGTRLVVLDSAFVRAAARWPSLLANVHRRLEAQREHLAIQGLITHLPRAEHRVLLTLWHLADRWGRITPEGTLLPLTLTHGLLGHLTAARRPTVTLAVGTLETAGYIRRCNDGSWLLTVAAEHQVRTIATLTKDARILGDAFRLSRGVAEARGNR
jgi:CRP/FNR family transcriptional regulator, cyclic AMP receptor protein